MKELGIFFAVLIAFAVFMAFWFKRRERRESRAALLERLRERGQEALKQPARTPTDLGKKPDEVKKELPPLPLAPRRPESVPESYKHEGDAFDRYLDVYLLGKKQKFTIKSKAIEFSPAVHAADRIQPFARVTHTNEQAFQAARDWQFFKVDGKDVRYSPYAIEKVVYRDVYAFTYVWEYTGVLGGLSHFHRTTVRVGKYVDKSKVGKSSKALAARADKKDGGAA